MGTGSSYGCVFPVTPRGGWLEHIKVGADAVGSEEVVGSDIFVGSGVVVETQSVGPRVEVRGAGLSGCGSPRASIASALLGGVRSGGPCVLPSLSATRCGGM